MNFMPLKKLMIATKKSALAILEIERQYKEAEKWLKEESEAKKDDEEPKR